MEFPLHRDNSLTMLSARNSYVRFFSWHCPFKLFLFLLGSPLSVLDEAGASEHGVVTCAAQVQCILHTKMCRKRQHSGFESTLQMHFFAPARGCWPLLRLCRPFMIFERCLHSVPKIRFVLLPANKIGNKVITWYSLVYIVWPSGTRLQNPPNIRQSVTSASRLQS